MATKDADTQEADVSFNHQHTHECPHCGYTWQYTGKLQKPSCPSCHGKVPPENRLEPSTEFHLVSLEGGRDDDPRFDTDVTIDTEEREGRVIVFLDLTQAECEAIWEQLRGDGHEYPEDARERVLRALQYNVQRAGRED